MFLWLLEREEGIERETGKHLCERETSVFASLPIKEGTDHLGVCPDENRTLSLLANRMTFQPAEPPSRGICYSFCHLLPHQGFEQEVV